ncbi:hypothetical protein AB8V66_01550 [Listeria ivanovii subsp. ivanovii]
MKYQTIIGIKKLIIKMFVGVSNIGGVIVIVIELLLPILMDYPR